MVSQLTETEMKYFLDSIMEDGGIMLSLRPISDPMNIDILAKIYERFPFIQQHKVVIPQYDSNGNIRYVETRRRLTCGKQYI